MVEKEQSRPAFFVSDMGTVEREIEFIDEYGERDEIARLEIEFGDTNVRILPAYSDRGRWSSKYAMHWNLPIEGDRTTFRCAQEQEEPQECLFCQAADMLRDSNPDLCSKWRAKIRYDFNVINTDSPEDGVLLMSLPPTAAGKIFSAAKKYGDPSHPETGYGFQITKKKTGKKAYNVEYTVWPDRNPSELEDWSVLENLNLLDEIFPAPKLEAQKTVLQLDTATGAEDRDRDTSPMLLSPPREEFAEEDTKDTDDGDGVTEPVSARDLLQQRILESRA